MARKVEDVRVERATERPVRVERPIDNGRHMDEGRRRRSPLGWLWPVGLLFLGILALILFFALRDEGGDDPSGASAGAGAAQEQTAQAGSGSGGGSGGGSGSGSAGGAQGTLSAGGQMLLPVPAASMLAGMIGQQVTGTSVPVQSVVSDEAFWVGTSEQDRMFVRLERGTESPFTVRAGERVSFSGVLAQSNAGLADQLGVTEAEGAQMLVTQGAYVDVKSGDIRSG